MSRNAELVIYKVSTKLLLAFRYANISTRNAHVRRIGCEKNTVKRDLFIFYIYIYSPIPIVSFSVIIR